jgi:uncharacterized protein YdhG (YjbR/CyaY superfamily)
LNEYRFTNIDDYIESSAPGVRPILEEIRKTIQKSVPSAKETISYQMTAFKRDKIFIYFAAFKKHIGIYPPVTNDEALRKELAPYANEKGNLKFLLSDDIPYALIARIAVALSKQYSG